MSALMNAENPSLSNLSFPVCRFRASPTSPYRISLPSTERHSPSSDAFGTGSNAPFSSRIEISANRHFLGIATSVNLSPCGAIGKLTVRSHFTACEAKHSSALRCRSLSAQSLKTDTPSKHSGKATANADADSRQDHFATFFSPAPRVDKKRTAAERAMNANAIIQTSAEENVFAIASKPVDSCISGPSPSLQIQANRIAAASRMPAVHLMQSKTAIRIFTLL